MIQNYVSIQDLLVFRPLLGTKGMENTLIASLIVISQYREYFLGTLSVNIFSKLYIKQ